MADVRAQSGVPVAAQFGGLNTPTMCAPLVVDSATGIIYSLKTGDVVIPAGGGITSLGTGVLTALGINVGSAGAFITFNGAGGTPSSMTATNLTGTAAGLTAGTVTTNANLTGPITSSGNATSIASGNTYPAPTFSGTTTPQGLVDISGASAGQIKFPATQNASADANTLDDYEEGTWTPADGSGATLTFTSVGAWYTKIGELVVASATVTYPVTADGSSSTISGYPFTSANIASVTQGVLSYHNGATATKSLLQQNNTTSLFFTNAGVNVTNLQMSAFLARFQSTYRI